MTPGRKPSTTASALSTRSRITARAASDFRSMNMRLRERSRMSVSGGLICGAPLAGRSIRITSAP